MAARGGSMTEVRHVGIVAVSSEGAALCYRTLCLDGAAILGRHAHPPVTMHTYSLSDYMRLMESGDWDGVGDLMARSARILCEAGAELLVCPDNTAHQAYDRAAAAVDVPWIHIAEEVAREAASRGWRRLGILGTRWLMEGPVYPSRLERRGIAYELPAPEDRARIDALIFDELVAGRFTAEARDEFVRVMAGLAERRCEAVVLGCTEIPLLVGPGDSPLPVLDSTRLLARAALREATAGALRREPPDHL
jgi:aspartate racemase